MAAAPIIPELVKPLDAPLPAFPYTEYMDMLIGLQDRHVMYYALWTMGRPQFSRDIPTAAVEFNKQGEYLRFIINPEFWETLSKTQRLFIIMHEASHVILGHGFRIKDCKKENRPAANAAADVVVNEMLVSQFGFKRDLIDPKNQYCWLDTVFPLAEYLDDPPLPDQTYEYYYNRLKKCGMAAGVGTPEGSADGKGKLMDSHVGLPDDAKLPQGFVDAISEIVGDEDAKDLVDQLKKRGCDPGSEVKEMAKKKPVPKRKWETIIRKWSVRYLKDDFKGVEQWLRCNRRFTTIQNAAMLPTEMEEQEQADFTKIDVCLFLDTSGSCEKLASRFWDAAMSLPPKRFNVKLYCFDTKVYDVDPAKRKLYGFGGTSFDIIEERIIDDVNNKKLSKYPEAVFIITDGDGNSVKPKKPENWYWFLTDGRTRYVPRDSKVYNLKDFE